MRSLGKPRNLVIVSAIVCAIQCLAADQPDHVPGRLLVSYRENVDHAALDRTLQRHGAVLRRHVPELRLQVLEVPEASSDAVALSLQQSGLYESVERDHYA